MSANDGFTLVTYKYPKQNKYKLGRSANTPLSFLENQTFDKEKNLGNIFDYIEQCKVELKTSKLYKEILFLLSRIICEDLEKDTKPPDFVCYGIGKVSECPKARYQFALLVLLWQHFGRGNCFVYDPIFGDTDGKIIEHFGGKLILKNEEAKRKVLVKTLFFVPHCGKPLYNNILWANWGLGLQNVIIFGNSFAAYKERIPSRQLKLEASYISQILPLTCELPLTKSFKHDDIFNDSSLHYFESNQLAQRPSLFWEDCKEPVYDDNSVEMIQSSSGH